MQIKRDQISPTKVKLTITADEGQLKKAHTTAVQELSKGVKLQGFREGKAPAGLVEKSIDQGQLHSRFLELAVNDLYAAALDQENLRPVAPPEIGITKFVPFSTLEISAESEVVGEVKLPGYQGLKVSRQESKVSAGQIDDVLQSLRGRAAERSEVKRAAKLGDEVTIDFKGVDAQTKEPLPGTDGQAYPLILGSGNFIPGFEDKVVGLKAGDSKDFTITFPKDYGVANMQGKKVTFSVTANKVSELKEPALDDKFAATVGPFQTLEELKKDIRRELEHQAKLEADQKYESALIEAIAAKTQVEIPKQLVESELDALENQEKQNVLYRGQTWQEHLDQEGLSEAEHRDKNRAGAEQRVKAGLILGAVADAEKLSVTPEELEIRMQLLKGRYASDPQMSAELDKPENRRDILSRLLTEKTLDRLKELN